jgi:hypothetical protein
MRSRIPAEVSLKNQGVLAMIRLPGMNFTTKASLVKNLKTILLGHSEGCCFFEI